jgi:hypothetical protein
MNKHKWYNEIVAWAMGCQIEQSLEKASGWTDWHDVVTPTFYKSGAEFRIKATVKEPKMGRCLICHSKVNLDEEMPQPKEKKYLYVFHNVAEGKYELGNAPHPAMQHRPIIGKIEVQDD